MSDIHSHSTALPESEWDQNEPLLQDETKRLNLYPIEHTALWEMHKIQENLIWHAGEVDLEKDMDDRIGWPALTSNEQYFVKRVLAFFACADSIVTENLTARFMREVKVKESQCFYGLQNHMENVHSETYSDLIDKFILDPQERAKAFDAVHTDEAVKKKVFNPNHSVGFMGLSMDQLIRELCATTIGFCMCRRYSILWQLLCHFLVKETRIDSRFCFFSSPTGLTFSNELISRDEGLHCKFACLLYSMLKHKLSTKLVHEIFAGAVETEKEFVRSSLPVDLIGTLTFQIMQV